MEFNKEKRWDPFAQLNLYMDISLLLREQIL